jgi:hypothetical protein
MSEKMNTRPATEDDLRTAEDPGSERTSNWTPPWVHVQIDGVAARAFVGNDGTWSEVLLIEFEDEVPEGMPVPFRTKYFHFAEPGRLCWGHDGTEHDVLLSLDHPLS